MSARPGDWSLLQLDGDPFPGDETAVSQQATHYRTVADAISDQITNLRNISNGDAKGLYVDKLADSAKDLANDLSKVHNRFDTVATQLKVWQPALAEGRTKSAALLREAETAHSNMTTNKPPDKPLPADATDAQKSAEKTRGQHYSSAQGELNGYVTAMKTELDHVRGIAKTVAHKISDASDDGVKDSWWDRNVRKWIQDHAHLIDIIVKVLEVVAIVIAVVALVLATGGFGAFALLGAGEGLLATMATVATALEWVGAGASLLVLAGHAAGKYAGVNDVSWGDIIGDFVSLATFGLGAGLGKLTTKALERGTSAAMSSVTRAAENGLASNIKNALRIGSETNPLRVWAAGERAAAVTAAQTRLTNVLKVLPKTLSINLTGGRELAEALAKARVLQNYPAAASAATRAINLTRAGVAISVYDRLNLVIKEIPELPTKIRELTGGEGGEGGG